MSAPTPRLQVSLQKYNTWAIGGAAQYFYQPQDVNDLQAYLRSRPQSESIMPLGLGSNVLVPDEGLTGSVLVLTPGLNQTTALANNQVRFEAGVTCAKAARFGVQQGWANAAFWAGIPGTIGGALAMNAGCFGHETWDFVTSVQVVDRHGHSHTRYPSEYQISYRSVLPHRDEIFVAATFEFQDALLDNQREAIKTLLRKRNDTQPIGLRSCGSVFTNPPGDHAARLIEAVGLKGKRQGGAVISTKHANFIINEQGATAKDVRALIALAQHSVFEQFGIRLQPEVRMLTNAISSGVKST